MKNNKILIIVIAFIALILFGLIVVNNIKSKTSEKFNDAKSQEVTAQKNKADKVSKEIIKKQKAEIKNEPKIEKTNNALKTTYKAQGILKVSEDDHIMGDKNAPVVMIEYASLSCPHCAAFNRESFAKIKEKYIDSSKLLFVFRNFPLNEPALVAAMFASCVSEDDNEKYFKTIKNIFKTQDAWAFDARFKKRLEALAKLEGMDSDEFNKCIGDDELKQKILSDRIAVSKELKIKSVPSFFINGELSSGYVDYKTLEKLIEKKLN